MPKLLLDLTRTPQEAVDYFDAKGDRITWDWHEMLRQEHGESFTVAKAASADVLAAIKAEVGRAIGSGQTFEQFKRTLKPRLMDLGWWGRAEVLDGGTGELTTVQLGSDRRLRTIFQTNVQTAYMAGRYKRQVDNAVARPYWQYIAVMDGRTRPKHAELNGRVFRWDDPIWQIIYPPNGFGCRCRVRSLTGAQFRALGIELSTSEGLIVTRTVELGDKTVEIRGLKGALPDGSDFYPDPGWDYNPGDAMAAQLRLQRIAEEKAAAARAVRPVPVKVDPAPLALASFDTKSKAGMWHSQAFGDSPDWIKQLVLREQEVRVQALSKKGAWAQGGDLIDTDGRTNDPRGLMTWRHEMGHILDYRLGKLGYVSSEPEFMAAMRADADAALSAKAHRNLPGGPDAEGADSFLARANGILGPAGLSSADFAAMLSGSTGTAISADLAALDYPLRANTSRLLRAVERKDIERFVAAFQTMERPRFDAVHVALSDLAGAATGNKACNFAEAFPGHSDKYYAQAPYLGPTECFANLTGLAGHKLPAWWTLAQHFFPQMTAVYERLIRSAIKA